jgi:hypothetical protein
MSSLPSVDRSAVTREKLRVSLCRFMFADGRRCRTPRSGSHPHFCFYHARKESQAQTADKLGRDLSYFFSGKYVSACDLSTALGRLLAAVARGDIKPKTATTLAYLAQTLVQTIHIAEHEYINAFGTDGWRRTVRNSVNMNSGYRHPQPEEPQEPEEVVEADEPEPSPAHPQSQAQAPSATAPPPASPQSDQKPPQSTPPPSNVDKVQPNNPAQLRPTTPQPSPNLPNDRSPALRVT